ncbi:MAG: hypothetical protein AB7G93_01525 [Bdellovibrionales bacterium]
MKSSLARLLFTGISGMASMIPHAGAQTLDCYPAAEREAFETLRHLVEGNPLWRDRSVFMSEEKPPARAEGRYVFGVEIEMQALFFLEVSTYEPTSCKIKYIRVI